MTGPALLRVRNVALVWLSSVVSATGTGAMFVALPFHTYVTTGSVVASAVVTLAEYAPTEGIAQVAGVLVDRWNPRGVLVAMNLALAACTLAYLVHESWWWLAGVAFVRSSVAQFASPASYVLIPAVAPPGRLAEVNGLNAIGGNVARLAGPALGGALVSLGGLRLVVLVDAASFVVAALLLVGVRASTRGGEGPSRGLLASWREGWYAIRRHAVLWPLVAVMALVGFGEGFISALLAPWMVAVVGGGSAELGLMLSLQAIGGVLGGWLVLRWAQRRQAPSLMCVGALVSAVLLLIIFNYPLVAPVGAAPAIALNAVAGLPFAVYGIAATIAVQTHSADGLRGRVASLTFGVQGIAQLAGIGLAGPAATLLGPLAINVDAVAYLIAGVLALRIIRRG